MARDRKDRSANWIVEHHGGSLLRLAKVSDFTRWQAAQTVMRFPKQVPDGLLDVTFPDRPTPDPFLIEIESYPEQDTIRQLRDDAAMTLLSRGVLPDILLVVLRPKGNLHVHSEQILPSAHGLSELRLKVRVVTLWTIPSAELLSANDVGLIPWVPLTDHAESPESLLHQCKERIEKMALPDEKGNLLAATRVMAEMRYNDPQLLSLLGEKSMSLQKIYEASPSVQWFAALKACEQMRHLVLRVLSKRFGILPPDLAAHLATIDDQDRLDALHDTAMDCAELDAFRAAMSKPP